MDSSLGVDVQKASGFRSLFNLFTIESEGLGSKSLAKYSQALIPCQSELICCRNSKYGISQGVAALIQVVET